MLPVFQRYDKAPVAVKVAFVPAHIAALVTPRFGKAFTVTTAEAVLEQPLAFVTVTEYPLVVVGLTVITLPDAPLLQAKVEPPDATKVAFEPAQMTGLFRPTLGALFTVTTAKAIVEQPLALVTVTE